MRKTGFLKPSEFHPEHFENGRNFKKSDFVAYIEASENLLKTLYTKYLFCIWGGVLLSFLFSKAVGGFAGNMLALVCLFTGLIAGGIINAKAVKRVNETAARLGITKADVAAARKHIKYGTVAWTNGEGKLRRELLRVLLENEAKIAFIHIVQNTDRCYEGRGILAKEGTVPSTTRI